VFGLFLEVRQSLQGSLGHGGHPSQQVDWAREVRQSQIVEEPVEERCGGLLAHLVRSCQGLVAVFWPEGEIDGVDGRDDGYPRCGCPWRPGCLRCKQRRHPSPLIFGGVFVEAGGALGDVAKWVACHKRLLEDQEATAPMEVVFRLEGKPNQNCWI